MVCKYSLRLLHKSNREENWCVIRGSIRCRGVGTVGSEESPIAVFVPFAVFRIGNCFSKNCFCKCLITLNGAFLYLVGEMNCLVEGAV